MIGINQNKPSLRASNVELFSRDLSLSYDESKIYIRDADNLYNLRLEKIINSSPTAKRCANMMAKYIVGNGVDDETTIVNTKGETINDLADRASNEIATQYGVYFYVTWTFEVDEITLKPKPVRKNIQVLDSILMAKSKKDDDGYDGKFYQLEFADKKETFKRVSKNTKWFYPYNDDKKVIVQQMKNDCFLKGIEEPKLEDLIKNYRGQVYYLNLTPKYAYALPPWDAVYNDMDTEGRISTYNNSLARTGWLGKTIVRKYDGDISANQEFEEKLKENLGSENSSKVLIVNVERGLNEDVTKDFVIDQLKPQFDDKLFENTKKTLRENISGNFNNIPTVLVFSGDGNLFGTNSNMYLEAKKFYWEQNEYERYKLEKTLSKLLDKNIKFLPMVKEELLEKDEDIKVKSQAELKWSVKGISALLEIQKSVSQGTTSRESAVEIIKEVFGIDEPTAVKMLGVPKTTENTI